MRRATLPRAREKGRDGKKEGLKKKTLTPGRGRVDSRLPDAGNQAGFRWRRRDAVECCGSPRPWDRKPDEESKGEPKKRVDGQDLGARLIRPPRRAPVPGAARRPESSIESANGREQENDSGRKKWLTRRRRGDRFRVPENGKATSPRSLKTELYANADAGPRAAGSRKAAGRRGNQQNDRFGRRKQPEYDNRINWRV